jgi:hypothetical protein
MKNLLLLSIACASLQAMPAVAGDCIPLTSTPVTISAPGKYCLASNLTFSGTTGNSVTIASSDVVLDCDGHTLKSVATSATGSSKGIYVLNRNNVVIKDCRIVGGYTHGIYVTQSNTVANKNYYINIENNYIAGPYSSGITAFGSAIELKGNRVYDVGGQTTGPVIGIRVGGSNVGFKFHLLRDNLVAGTNSATSAAFGIYSDASQAGIFIENGVSGTTASNTSFNSYGIRVGGTYNRITDNHIVGSGGINDIGIYSTSVTTSCYDNYIRAGISTQTCNAELGNY